MNSVSVVKQSCLCSCNYKTVCVLTSPIIKLLFDEATCSPIPSFPSSMSRGNFNTGWGTFKLRNLKRMTVLVSGHVYHLLGKLQRKHFTGILKNCNGFLAETWIIISVIRMKQHLQQKKKTSSFLVDVHHFSIRSTSSMCGIYLEFTWH